MSKFSGVLLLGVALAYCFCVIEVHGQEKSCKAAVADLTKRQLGGIAKCTKSMKFKNGKDKAAKSTCILKCVMINEGILDEKGQMTIEATDAFLEKVFAPDLRPNIRKHFIPCVEEFASSLDNEEEFCRTYDPVIKCITGKMPLFCAT